MNKLNFQNLSVYFFIFSFLGWVTEVIYSALIKKQVVNRGFLVGPLCPIYGFGLLLIILLLHYFDKKNDLPMIIIFIAGMILCTTIEIISGFTLKKLFNLRWWDYSTEPFNIGGYACLKFSIYWGLGVVLIVDIIRHLKTADYLIDFSTFPYIKYFLIIAYTILLFDLCVTILSITKLGQDSTLVSQLRTVIGTPAETISQAVGGILRPKK